MHSNNRYLGIYYMLNTFKNLNALVEVPVMQSKELIDILFVFYILETAQDN